VTDAELSGHSRDDVLVAGIFLLKVTDHAHRTFLQLRRIPRPSSLFLFHASILSPKKESLQETQAGSTSSTATQLIGTFVFGMRWVLSSPTEQSSSIAPMPMRPWNGWILHPLLMSCDSAAPS